jgi:hypothetical protein
VPNGLAKRSNLKRFEMIKLKTEVSKSAVMRELQAKAIEGFKDSWQPELQVQAYMNGAHDLFKLLRLGDVVKSLPQDNYCQVCNLPTDGEKCYSKRCPV